MAVKLRNPMSVVIKSEEVGPTTSGISITGYHTSTGVITGTSFGTTSGKVWLLNRDTHSYVEQSVSSWSDTSITLTAPIDLSAIQGSSCFYVETAEGLNSHKWMVYGDGTLTVPTYGLVYVKNEDGTITKITATSSLSVLTGAANNFGKDVTIGGQTINTAQIVGVQFGSASFTAPANFLSGLMILNQPVVFPSSITLSTTSTYMFRYDYVFDCPVVFSSGHQRVGNYFMSTCTSFNQPLDISMFNYMVGTYFMQNCYSFNQPIKFPTTLSSSNLGTYFMQNCRAFNQPLNLPDNVGILGNYFLSGCQAFNSPINTSGVTQVNTYFMSQCYAFNQPLSFKYGTTFGNNFMNNCSSFDSRLTLPTSLTITPTNFMTNCYSFNQPLDVSHVISFNQYFMSNCWAFNQPLNLAACTTINAYFLNNCSSYSYPITLRSAITSVAANFCVGHYVPHIIVAETANSPTDNNSLSVNYTTSGGYLVGHTIKGSQRSTWLTNLPDRTANPYRKLNDGGA